MAEYHIFGLVHPERAKVSMKMPFSAINDQGHTDRFEIRVINNQIYIKTTLTIPIDIYSIRNFCIEAVSDGLAIISFVKGLSHSVEITRIICDELEIDFVFGVEIPILEERGKDKDLEKETKKIATLTNSDPHLGNYIRKALRDLNDSMKSAANTAFFCFRAVESLRHYCEEKYHLDEEKAQWQKLGEITGFGPQKTKFVREKAFPNRHGELSPITDAERARIYTETWDIFEKFIEAESRNLS